MDDDDLMEDVHGTGPVETTEVDAAAARARLHDRAVSTATRAASLALRWGVVMGSRGASRLVPESEALTWHGAPVKTGRPLLFVGGYASVPELYQLLIASYKGAGIERVRIVPLIDYAFCDIGANAQQLARVAALIDGPFDIVGHSEGGLIARTYIKLFGGAERVEHLITLGTPHLGFPPLPEHAPRLAANVMVRSMHNRVAPIVAPRLHAATSLSARQMLRGSDFLRELNGLDEDPPDPTPGPTLYLSIASRHDGVVPFSTTILPDAPNVANVTIDDSWHNGNHLSIASTNQKAFDATMSFLLRKVR